MLASQVSSIILSRLGGGVAYWHGRRVCPQPENCFILAASANVYDQCGPTMLSEPAKTTATPRASGSYFARHWRGELSTAKSLWLNGVALSVLVFFSVIIMADVLTIWFRGQPARAVTLIVGVFLIAICISLWSLIGLYRTERSHKGERRLLSLARALTVIWLGYVSLGWVWSAKTLITTYYNCTTGADFGPTANFFNLGPCEVAEYPHDGLVVRRLPRSYDRLFQDPFN